VIALLSRPRITLWLLIWHASSNLYARHRMN